MVEMHAGDRVLGSGPGQVQTVAVNLTNSAGRFHDTQALICRPAAYLISAPSPLHIPLLEI